MADLPTIETARLRIAPFKASDISHRYIGWLNDPDVVRYSEQRHRRHTAESCAAYLAAMNSGPGHFSALRLRESGLHIGNISTRIDAPNRIADIAILIGAKSVWGQGYGLEAWKAVMTALFSQSGFRKLTAGCMDENRAMKRIMERAGMKFEYRRPAAFLLDGREVDSVHFAAYRAPDGPSVTS